MSYFIKRLWNQQDCIKPLLFKHTPSRLNKCVYRTVVARRGLIISCKANILLVSDCEEEGEEGRTFPFLGRLGSCKGTADLKTRHLYLTRPSKAALPKIHLYLQVVQTALFSQVCWLSFELHFLLVLVSNTWEVIVQHWFVAVCAFLFFRDSSL